VQRHVAGIYTFEIPASLVPGGYRVEIVSRFSGGRVLLKEPRTITYPVVLTVSEAKTA